MYSDPDCPLCPSNGGVDIVAKTGIAYLVEAKTSPVEGCFLIVPTEHITHPMELSPRWQMDFGALLVSVPWYEATSSYNISLNMGVAAGQTVPHLHFWVIPRAEVEGASTYGQGLVALLRNVDALADYISH